MQRDADFRAALHRVAGAPIKQVFATFGQDPTMRALFREVLRSLVTKAPGVAAAPVAGATAAIATAARAPDGGAAASAPETPAPTPTTTGSAAGDDDDRKPAAVQKPADGSGKL